MWLDPVGNAEDKQGRPLLLFVLLDLDDFIPRSPLTSATTGPSELSETETLTLPLGSLPYTCERKDTVHLRELET